MGSKIIYNKSLWSYKSSEARYQVKGISERAFLLMIVNRWFIEKALSEKYCLTIILKRFLIIKVDHHNINDISCRIALSAI